MADIVACITEPAKRVGEWIGEQILNQLTFIWFFTANINGLKDEFQKLKDDTEELEGEVQTARDNRSQKPVPRVTTWLRNSNNLKVKIDGILKEAEKVGSGVSDLGARFSVSKRAKETTERTKKLRAEKPSAQFQPGPTAATQEVELGKTFECESRNKIEEDIMTALRGGNVNMIGICGMGGLGKTTMAKKLMNRALKNDENGGQLFQEIVMVTVSQDVNISKIQEHIGDKLGLEKLKDANQTKRADMLLSRLRDSKRTLLVLDDVWNTPPLESIGIPCDSRGCTVLFTSRNRDVLHDMGIPIFGMKVLSEDEAWSFFREKVGSYAEDTKLKPIAKDVAKECGGLPINIAAVGAVLKDKRIQRLWNHTLDQLKQSVPNNVQYDRVQNYNPLKLSYEYLKSEDRSKPAESIFLLCCLFPEDADIPLDYLTYFCMGLGGIFEDNITNMEKARDLMWTKTELLKDRSLLLESDKEDCVRMHDVVRDVCTLIAKEELYIGKDGGRWISSSHLVEESNELLSVSRCPNVNLLFLDNRYDSSGFQFDGAFQKGMTELHVLCIERYSLTTLPPPTQSLGNLKTLILVSCDKLETISVVGELVNLEILICRDCWSIKELPTEMKGLDRLKLLDLTECRRLQSIGRGIISSLARLEELKMLNSFEKWEAEEREERENASIKELEALTNLTCLEIEIRDHSILMENMPLLSKKIVRFIIRNNYFVHIPPEFSKAMGLLLEREIRFGDWIEMKFLRDTEYLYLKGYGANNLNFAKSQNIRWLELHECGSMKNIATTSGGDDDAIVFPSLEDLELEYLPELQEICDGPISSTSFHNLKKLQLKYLGALTQIWKSSRVPQNNNVPHFSNLASIKIYECDRLRNLGQLSMAGKDCLPHLQHLDISFCEMMEQVFLWNEEEEGENKTSILITKVFPKLTLVKLGNLPNLKTFYQGIQGIEFPLLQKMKIERCPKWKSIIDRSNSADIDDEDGYLHLFCQPQKVSFGSSFKVLEIDYNPFCGHEISSSLFNGLVALKINNYIGSTSLFTLSVAVNILVSLKVLYIFNCDEMIKVIEEEQQQERILVFPKLEILQLKFLPKLVSFCDLKCDVEFPSLTQVEITDCPNMESLSMGFVAAPNLKIVKIDYKQIEAAKDLNGALHQLYIARQEEILFSNRILHIHHNPFYGHEIPSSVFNCLEELTISEYEGSMSLFTLSVAANLLSLRKLSIFNCDEVMKLIEDEQQVASGGERIIVFPKLEKLYLKQLPKLVTCVSKCEVELPSLRKMEIYRCHNMVNFSLGLVATPKLEAFKTDLTTHVGVGVNIAFNSLKRLKIRENENPFDHHKVSVSLFNGLERLVLYDYKGSVSIFSCKAVWSLVNLKVFGLGKCDEIVKVMEEEEEVVSGGEVRNVVFPKLEEIYLYELPNLVRFCEWKCDVELPSLREVRIYHCPNMESFSMRFVDAPNLKIVEIDDEEIDTTKDLNVAVQQHYLTRQEKGE